jgi:hypothetical protein
MDTASTQSTIEVVIDANGAPRQAGASQAEGEFIKELKEAAERNLYVFSKAILGRNYLDTSLHGGIARFLTRTPPYRKLLLLPREHAKTSLVSHALPAHAIIQPKERNVYVGGRAGVDTRILLAGETIDRAGKNLSTIQTGIFENNKLFRALWPQVVWEAKPAKRWNAQEMVVPRNVDYPDPTVQALGVDGAIAGGRFDIVIKDDLISLEAANSPTVMEKAIIWHRASRALFESDTTLEFIIGTRWAVFDLYSFILEGGVVGGESFEKDYTVQSVVRSIVEGGKVIYPGKFALVPEEGKQDVPTLKKQFGLLFYLNYMNSAANPELTDFSLQDVRFFEIRDGKLLYDIGEDSEGAILEVVKDTKPLDDGMKGRKLTQERYDYLRERKEMLNLNGWRR